MEMQRQRKAAVRRVWLERVGGIALLGWLKGWLGRVKRVVYTV
jgi:hypothetical protein